jgi:hypothetical protein
MIKSKGMRWPWYVGHDEKINACRILMEKLGGKRTLGRTRRRWENNIKMDLREVE